MMWDTAYTSPTQVSSSVSRHEIIVFKQAKLMIVKEGERNLYYIMLYTWEKTFMAEHFSLVISAYLNFYC